MLLVLSVHSLHRTGGGYDLLSCDRGAWASSARVLFVRRKQRSGPVVAMLWVVHIGIVRHRELDEPPAYSSIRPQAQVSLYVSLAVVPCTLIKQVGRCLGPFWMSHVESRGMWDYIRDALLTVSLGEIRQHSRSYSRTYVRRRERSLFDDRPPNSLQRSVDLPLLFDRPAQRVGLHGRNLGFSPWRVGSDRRPLHRFVPVVWLSLGDHGHEACPQHVVGVGQ